MTKEELEIQIKLGLYPPSTTLHYCPNCKTKNAPYSFIFFNESIKKGVWKCHECNWRRFAITKRFKNTPTKPPVVIRWEYDEWVQYE